MFHIGVNLGACSLETDRISTFMPANVEMWTLWLLNQKEGSKTDRIGLLKQPH